MTPPAEKPKQPERLRLPLLIVCIGMIFLLAGVGIQVSQNGASGTSPLTMHTPVPLSDPTTSSTVQVNPGSVSPLLFGTNMSLYDSNDQVINSVSTQNQLQQLHLRIIRMPVRSALSNETEILAARTIKSVGAYALVVLRGAVDDTVLADDLRIVNDLNSVFGHATVYYEYGNEEDLLGVDVGRYTDSWNSIVPQLKRAALNGQFIGPVNFQFDQQYLADFLQHANPRPDAVSWHEYTCQDSWSNDLCIARIDHWTNHINSARQTMQSTINTTLPIMITEWNYAPDAQSNDGKINNDSFMTTWTTKALETLAADHVFASMQYTCTNSVYALITGTGAITAQGTAIASLYQRMIHP